MRVGRALQIQPPPPERGQGDDERSHQHDRLCDDTARALGLVAGVVVGGVVFDRRGDRVMAFAETT